MSKEPTDQQALRERAHQALQRSISEGESAEQFRARLTAMLATPDASGAVPLHPGSESWIEAGHHSESGAELRLAFAEPLPTGHNPFWVPISCPDGSALGWLQFSYLTTAHQKSHFGATAWRSPQYPAPAEQELLPLPIPDLPCGFAEHCIREGSVLERLEKYRIESHKRMREFEEELNQASRQESPEAAKAAEREASRQPHREGAATETAYQGARHSPLRHALAWLSKRVHQAFRPSSSS